MDKVSYETDEIKLPADLVSQSTIKMDKVSYNHYYQVWYNSQTCRNPQ